MILAVHYWCVDAVCLNCWLWNVDRTMTIWASKPLPTSAIPFWKIHNAFCNSPDTSHLDIPHYIVIMFTQLRWLCSGWQGIYYQCTAWCPWLPTACMEVHEAGKCRTTHKPNTETPLQCYTNSKFHLHTVRVVLLDCSNTNPGIVGPCISSNDMSEPSADWLLAFTYLTSVHVPVHIHNGKFSAC